MVYVWGSEDNLESFLTILVPASTFTHADLKILIVGGTSSVSLNGEYVRPGSVLTIHLFILDSIFLHFYY